MTWIREEPAPALIMAFKACAVGEPGKIKTQSSAWGQVYLSVLHADVKCRVSHHPRGSGVVSGV